MKKTTTKTTRRKLKKSGADCMLDSGAYTAYTKGVTIPLDDYIEFAATNEDKFGTVVALDVIPGKGTSIEQAMDQSLANAITMRKGGVEPMAVFHAGEPMSQFFKIVDAGFSYIGLGGTARKMSNKARQGWLRTTFRAINAEPGLRENIRLHGFGVTGTDAVTEFDWDTVDSISWMLYAGMGQVMVPRRPGDYLTGTVVKVTPSISKSGQFEFHRQGENVQRVIREYLVSVGCDPDKDDYMDRRIANAAFYKRFGEQAETPLHLAFSHAAPWHSLTPLMKHDCKHWLVSYWTLLKYWDDVDELLSVL